MSNGECDMRRPTNVRNSGDVRVRANKTQNYGRAKRGGIGNLRAHTPAAMSVALGHFTIAFPSW
jgi:hypothetical protein